MKKNKALLLSKVENALEAIDAVFSDTSVDVSETLDAMLEINSIVQGNLLALKDQMRVEGRG